MGNKQHTKIVDLNRDEVSMSKLISFYNRTLSIQDIIPNEIISLLFLFYRRYKSTFDNTYKGSELLLSNDDTIVSGPSLKVRQTIRFKRPLIDGIKNIIKIKGHWVYSWYGSFIGIVANTEGTEEYNDPIPYHLVGPRTEDAPWRSALGVTHLNHRLLSIENDQATSRPDWGKFENNDIITMIADFRDIAAKKLFFYQNGELVNKIGIRVPNEEKYEEWYPCICVFKYGKYEILDDDFSDGCLS